MGTKNQNMFEIPIETSANGDFDLITQPVGECFACIDIGTNSVKIIVAALSKESAVRVFEQSVITRLGEGMDTTHHRLLEVPIRRTLDGLTELLKGAEAYPFRSIACVGTAALRDASNPIDLTNRAKSMLNLDIEVISGKEEARLSYLAVRKDPHWLGLGTLNVIDIGGGSTEVIEGEAETDSVRSRTSVNIGAVKLTDRFLKSNPPSVAQLNAANIAMMDAFDAASIVARNPAHQAPTLVGVGGTVTNLAAMCIGGPKEIGKIHGFNLTAQMLDYQITKLTGMGLVQKQQIPGLDPRRADIILAGALLLSEVMGRLGAETISVSTRGLRWGVLYDRFMNSNTVPTMARNT